MVLLFQTAHIFGDVVYLHCSRNNDQLLVAGYTSAQIFELKQRIIIYGSGKLLKLEWDLHNRANWCANVSANANMASRCVDGKLNASQQH